MLDFFPTPLPDEWWYSTLCRYFISRGGMNHYAIKEELFGNGNAHMGTLFPNKTIAVVVKQLPPSVFNFEDILLNHTLFKYYVRFYPESEKQYLMKYLSEEGCPQLTHLWRSYGREDWKIRYCPVCAQEDYEEYGESYYHLSHQIPLVSVCQKHHCKLKYVDTGNTKRSLNNMFRPLSQQDISYEADYDVPDSKKTISEIALSHLTLPLSYGPTEGYNNLYQKICNDGYYNIPRSKGVNINVNNLRKALVEMYGPELIEQVFGPTLNMGIMLRIRRFEQLLPDRYVLLQGLVGMKSEELFSDQVLQDNLKELITSLSKNTYSSARKVGVANGLKEYEVNSLCRHYGIEPFWSLNGRGKQTSEPVKKLYCTVSISDYEQLKKNASENGYKRVIDYLLNCEKYLREEKKI